LKSTTIIQIKTTKEFDIYKFGLFKVLPSLTKKLSICLNYLHKLLPDITFKKNSSVNLFITNLRYCFMK